MKKTLILISFLMVCISSGNTQNLVFNPSFEDSVANPDWGSFVSNMAGWFPTLESPDLFSPYCNASMDHPPSNWAGYQDPYHGLSYVGLAAYSSSPPGYRELIETQLISDLVIGQKYFFSMYISRSDSCPAMMGTGPACNNMGARFSVNSHYLGTPPAINNLAHVHSDTICFNMTNWNRISGSFIADSAYRYLTLGNFFDDSNTDTADGGNGTMPYAYYFIDMVCVSTDSLECNPTASKPGLGTQGYMHEDQINVYPNPATEFIHFKLHHSQHFTLCIYDCYLKKISEKLLDTEGTIYLDNQESGVYFYEIRYDNQKVKFGKFIKL